MKLTGGRKLPQLTIALIAISLIVGLMTQLGHYLPLVTPLKLNWAELYQGQVWRVITPIFLHFGALHLIFNMLWLWELGRAIELRFGLYKLAMLVAVCGIGSNFAQLIWSGPHFGGMSGVVYALLAYIYIQGKFNPWSGLYVHRNIMAMMMAWFVLCWTGLLGPIANMAHTGGLVLGALWGYIDTLRVNYRR